MAGTMTTPTADPRTDAEKLTAAILYRRLRKCIAADNHTENCQRCGTK